MNTKQKPMIELHHSTQALSVASADKKMRVFLAVLGFVMLLLVLNGCSTTSTSKTDGLRAQAVQAFKDGDPKSGFSLLEQALRKDPGSTDLGNLYRQYSVKNEKQDRSIEFLKELVAGDNVPDGAHFNLAFAYVDNIPKVGPVGGAFLSKRSIEQFDSVYQNNPKTWDGNYGLGMNYLHWPDFFKTAHKAVFHLKINYDSLDRNNPQPRDLLTYIRLGDAYIRNGEIDEAYVIWEEGLKKFPGHPDLSERVKVSKKRISAAIKEAYIPKGSTVAAIDTDISILWSKEAPTKSIASLKSNIPAGKLKSKRLTRGKLGLYAWFRRNLPYIRDEQYRSHLDTSPLSIDPSVLQGDPRSIAAYGVISGLVAVLDDNSGKSLAEKAKAVGPFLQPFFYEGVGIGITTMLDTSEAVPTKGFGKLVKSFCSGYENFCYTGIGFRYGLDTTLDLERVSTLFTALGSAQSSWAYDGFGFSVSLFHLKRNKEVLVIGKTLKSTVVHGFYHGVGRGFRILAGSDIGDLNANLKMVPTKYINMVHEGYGDEVSLLEANKPEIVFAYLGSPWDQLLNQKQFISGVTLGYARRNAVDSKHMAELIDSVSNKDKCRINALLAAGKTPYKQIQAKSGDVHSNWSQAIDGQIEKLSVQLNSGCAG
ncbi:hypothetical protein MNBD_GAMMA21-2723 [hydrothermal vent metagenome]|uniref:Uncharacterized protein n=1 Tax=hydrothermal vent metagenome TaxID=652676 RepID=A0A3B1A5E2_9ZZZZ